MPTISLMSNHERLSVQVAKQINLYYFSSGIKGWKTKFWFGGFQNPYRCHVIYMHLFVYVILFMFVVVNSNHGDKNQGKWKYNWCWTKYNTKYIQKEPIIFLRYWIASTQLLRNGKSLKITKQQIVVFVSYLYFFSFLPGVMSVCFICFCCHHKIMLLPNISVLTMNKQS